MTLTLIGIGLIAVGVLLVVTFMSGADEGDSAQDRLEREAARLDAWDAIQRTQVFPPMTQKAAKGGAWRERSAIRLRDESIGRDAVTAAERKLWRDLANNREELH